MIGAEFALVALTLNVYCEARGESYNGQQAVADVTMKRAVDIRWPSDVTSVVLQRRQFSWVGAAGIKDAFGLIEYQRKVLANANSLDLQSYRQAEAIAKRVLTTGYKPKYDYTHYHTTAIKPVWTKNQRIGLTIGSHQFYNIARTY